MMNDDERPFSWGRQKEGIQRRAGQIGVASLRHFFAAVFAAGSLAAADVKTAGAMGDGRTDDTAAIEKAVMGGGSVVFPTGTYRLTRTIAINLDRTGFVALVADGTARIVMAGAGPAFQINGTHATSSAAPSSVKPNVWANERAPRVDGLEIVGNHPEADGIAAQGTMQLTITRVLIREVRHGVRLHGLNRNVLISDSHIYHCNGIGIFYDAVNLHQSNITGSHISYNRGGGVVVRGGNVFNIQIGNCDIESNMAADATPTANVLIDATGGILGEVAVTGCTIQHNSNAAPGCANIRILGGGTERMNASVAAQPTREGYVTITGNILSDVTTNVHLKQVRGVTLTGNTMYLGVEHDLFVEDSSHVLIGPNNLTLSARYEKSFAHVSGGVEFLRSRDCTITGLHINGVRHHPAAVRLQQCERMSVSNASILDCDGSGVELLNTSLTYVTGCIVRDDRDTPNPSPALLVSGGTNNLLRSNVLDRPVQMPAASGVEEDNRTMRRTGPRAESR